MLCHSLRCVHAWPHIEICTGHGIFTKTFRFQHAGCPANVGIAKCRMDCHVYITDVKPYLSKLTDKDDDDPEISTSSYWLEGETKFSRHACAFLRMLDTEMQ